MSAEAAPNDPAAASTLLLETLKEPGFRQLMTVAVAENANARALFVELPLAAAVLTGKMMGMTQDRPPEQRFKPIMARLRFLSETEIAEALCLSKEDAAAHPALQELPAALTESSYLVIFGVLIPASEGGADAHSLVTVARFSAESPSAAATLGAAPAFKAQPSKWAELGPPPKRLPEPAAGKEDWLFCTHKGKGRSPKRPMFQWTGRLRPHPISPYRSVPPGPQRPDYATTGWPAAEMESRQQQVTPIRSPAEIEGLRAACRLGRTVLDACVRAVRPGVTTDEIDKVAHDVTVAGGGYPSPLNYCSFPKSCCTSVNEVICHGIPDERPLEEGDIVNLDISVFLNGFHGDLNETVAVGKVDDASLHLLRGAFECLQRAIAIVKPGTRFREVGDVISAHAGRQELSVVRTYCGHGIGEHFHCAPNIPHYANNKAVGVMKPGMTFTIEPMINQGTWKDTTWPDGWTSVTLDGKRSAQFEHTMVVTETGVEVLTARLPDSPSLGF